MLARNSLTRLFAAIRHRTVPAVAALTVLTVLTPPLHGQAPQKGTSIIVDAMVFHAPGITGKEFTDVYVAVPYQSIQFQQHDGRFVAAYNARISIRDLLGRTITDTTIRRSVIEESYQVSQGSTGKADNIPVRFLLSPGSYRYEVMIEDQFSHREFTRTDTISVRDLSLTPALSSLMYVSQIEERSGRYAITPFIGSGIWDNSLHLFVFFEVYLETVPADVAIGWKITSADDKILVGGLGAPTEISQRTSQHFFPITAVRFPASGRYTMHVMLHPVSGGVADTSVILAQASRPYIIPRTLSSSVLSDLTKAIKQLAYVATQADMDNILAGTTEGEREYRFDQFWKTLDPTPNTVINEAFDEYYGRIATANRLFKTYADGWITDMGRVYIIYGEPTNKERARSVNGLTEYERWTYPDHTFMFEDSGFGEWRLRTPMPADAKYRYHR